MKEETSKGAVEAQAVLTISEAHIDAGAEALRDLQMAAKPNMRSWKFLPPSVKRKWRVAAAVVLAAAMKASG